MKTAAILLLFASQAQVKDVTVSAPTRLDWAFAVRGFGKDAATLPAKFSSTTQKYQLHVPMDYKADRDWPLVVFISPSNGPSGWNNWKKTCEKDGVLFCSPYMAGNDVAAGQRTRIILDVVDDVRRKYRIDPDQTYLSGFSGGGRMACAIGFSLPEVFAGVAPVCGTNPIMEPTYLRHRLVDRVSVAFLTGEKDFNRKENEVYMAPYAEELGIRTKLWVVPGLGHGIPKDDVIEEAYRWLKGDLPRRRADRTTRPELAIKSDEAPSAEEQAKRLTEAATKDLANKSRVWNGVALLQGVVGRWPKTDAGRTVAAVMLKRILDDEKAIEAIAEQGAADEKKSLSAQAKALERFGDLESAARAWTALARNYAGTPFGDDAEKNVRRLRREKK
jgi:predicted esterase